MLGGAAAGVLGLAFGGVELLLGEWATWVAVPLGALGVTLGTWYLLARATAGAAEQST